MFFFVQGLAPPWFGSPGPLVPWSSVSWCFGPLVLVPWSSGPLASRLQWLLGFSALVASGLLGFSGFVALGFLASRLQWLLASWLQWLLASWFLGLGGSVASQDLNNFISRMAT